MLPIFFVLLLSLSCEASDITKEREACRKNRNRMLKMFSNLLVQSSKRDERVEIQKRIIELIKVNCLNVTKKAGERCCEC